VLTSKTSTGRRRIAGVARAQMAQLSARVMMIFSHRQFSRRLAFASRHPALAAPSPTRETRAIVRAAGRRCPRASEAILEKAEGSPSSPKRSPGLFSKTAATDSRRRRRLADATRRRGAHSGTVREVIAARLDRPVRSRSVVQVASVLGRQFHREQLARLLEVRGSTCPRCSPPREPRHSPPQELAFR
jgi:hypothetical protein